MSNSQPILNYLPKLILPNPLHDSKVYFDMILPPLRNASRVNMLSNVIIRLNSPLVIDCMQKSFFPNPMYNLIIAFDMTSSIE